MKVSVIIATYNHERFIAQAVESVLLQQTDFDVETLIADDCSTDHTRPILIDLHRRYPDKIHLLLQEENRGSGRNRMDALQQCRGEYIAFLDGDDYWACPHKLQKQVAFLDAHRDFSLCGHRYRPLHDDGQHLTEGTLSPALKEVWTLDVFLDYIARAWIIFSTMMVRRAMIPPIPAWWYEIRNGDVALQFLCLANGKIGFLNNVTMVYRIHKGGGETSAKPEVKAHAKTVLYTHYKQSLAKSYGTRYDAVLNGKIASKYYWLADYYQQQGRLDKSRVCLEKARTYNPSPLWLSIIEIKRLLRQAPSVYAFLKTLNHLFLKMIGKAS